MDALVRGFALLLVLCLTLNAEVAAAARFPKACADPDVQTLIDVQNSCTSANSSCNIMIPVSRSTIRWTLGCVNPAALLPPAVRQLLIKGQEPSKSRRFCG